MLTIDQLQELINNNIQLLRSEDRSEFTAENIKSLYDNIASLIVKHDPAATHLYALMHKHGIGVPQSEEECVKHLARAIILGRQDAERDFWGCFNSSNYNQMLALIKTIADSGNFVFAHCYAGMCEHGTWGDKNISEAIRYYEIAASIGPQKSNNEYEIAASLSARDSKRAANRLKEPDEQLKVKQPYFLKIMLNDKIAYLLGTFHIAGWNVFPAAMQDIIRKCNGVISEGLAPAHVEEKSIETNLHLVKHIRKSTDLDWFSLLPFELQSLCTKMWLHHLSLNPSDIKNVAELKITTVFELLQRLSAFRSNWAEMLEDALETHYKNVSNIYGKMDFDIEDVLELKGGLEQDLVYDKISSNDFEDDPENALINLIFILLNLAKSTNDEAHFEKLCDDLETSLQPLISKNTGLKTIFNKTIANKISYEDMLKQEILKAWEKYASGDDLHDIAAAITLEQEDINTEGSASRKRNTIMLESALYYINNLTGPILITCGVNHLLGGTGLLLRLSEAGAKLELYCSDTNSFRPYVYPYKYYLMGLTAIKQGLFFPPSPRVNCTAIIPYTSNEQFLSRFKPGISI